MMDGEELVRKNTTVLSPAVAAPRRTSFPAPAHFIELAQIAE